LPNGQSLRHTIIIDNQNITQLEYPTPAFRTKGE